MRLQDFATLAQAQAYETTQPRLIHRDSMNSLLASAGLYVALKAIAQDATSPFQNLISAFLDSTEYNFIIGDGTTTGDRQIAALDSIIAAGGDLGAAMSGIRPLILGMANPTYKPFEKSTKHDFAVAKNDLTRFKSVSDENIQNGYLQITTIKDCEKHRPNVYIKIHNEYVRIANFQAVTGSAVYLTIVYNHKDLFVDDVYRVIK